MSFAETAGLTEQQQRPLAVRDASVALGAGAGCGKTTVLTARFLEEIERQGPLGLGGIVVLTFTEKAARELRQRIRERCREKLAAGENPDHWRAVLRGLEAAPIGTFHEFCGQWLRRHAVEAGVDPDFTILDAAIAGTLRDEALSRSVRGWLAALDPDLIELSVEFGLRRVRESLADLLSDRGAGRLADWAERTPDDLVEIWRAAWERDGRALLFRKVVRASRACTDLLSRHESTHAKMHERRAFLLEWLPTLDPSVDADRLESVCEHARVQGGGGKAHWPSTEIYEAVGASFTQLRDAIKKYVAKSRWDEGATREAADQGLKLVRLALRARQAYGDAKRARGGLDFDDLLVKTRDLLRQNADVLQASAGAGGPIARLLVDEFQDTDPIQAEILEGLLAGDVVGGRLFLVGDFKQSIYRFRGAQPRLFEDFRARFPQKGRHALTENFRSVAPILDFVNALFADAFPGSENALLPRRNAEPDAPAVEFLWANEPLDAAGTKPGAHERRAVEARWIARRLKERIEQGWTIQDRATNQVRNANAGDIAFLFRAMTDVGSYESALDEEGFDYHTIGGAAFYAQQEVHDLINVLSVLEDPLDPVALAGALRSPFFCLSDDALYWLGTEMGELITGFEHAGEIDELSPIDRRRALRAQQLLESWRGLKDRFSIAAMVDRVLDESGYEAALLGEFLGARKRANARKLVRLARRYDEEGGFTLAAFVGRLRADLKRPPREEQAATTDEEGRSVRLMSIHQAKGLEFPIVVVPDLNRKINPQLDPVAFDPALGPLVRPSQDPGASEPGAGESEEAATRLSLGWLTYQTIEQREDEEEALRLFYVATTRARDALILSAGIGPGDKAVSPAMLLLEERFDRLTGECQAVLPNGWRSPGVHVVREAPGSASGAGRSRRWSAPLLEAADVIERAVVADRRAAPAPIALPRFVALDPAVSLPATAARRDRLTRALLADPAVWSAEDWSAAAAEAAGRCDPLATSERVQEAIEQLRPWIDGMLGRALRCATAVERRLEWTLAWPPEQSDATVFAGQADLIVHDADGTRRVVLITDARVPAGHERLRVLLSGHAANLLGLGPISQGWRIGLGDEGGLVVENTFDPEAIDVALGAYLAEDQGAGAAGAAAE